MAGRYYNSRRVPGQMNGVMTNMMAGLNSYEKSDMIGDNNLSDAWDATFDQTTKGISLYSRSTNVLIVANATGSGKVVDAIAAKDINGLEKIVLLTKDNAGTYDELIDDLVIVYEGGNTKTTIDISSYNLSYTYTSMCLFSTEAARYVCFTASGVKKFFYYDFTTLTAVTIPFYPKKITSHYNRVFAIDTGNKLWWCRAGDLSSWYGVEEDDDRIVTLTNMLDSTAYSIAAQPDVPRPLEFTVATVNTADTLGTLTVVGTDSIGLAQTKTYTPITGKYITPDTWKTVTSITATGHVTVGTVDTIKIGIAPVSGYVQSDSGVWTMEQEYALVDMAVLGASLYIFTPINIYVFQGYSYDTFSLTKIIANLGCKLNTEITTCGNIAYFWGTTNDLYEYNGNDYPTIINRSVYVNGSISNGIYGSLETYNNNIYLTAIAGKLYVYSDTSTDATVVVVTPPSTTYWHQLRVYEFDIKSRSWWKRAGFSSTYNSGYASNYIFAKYIQNVAKTDVYSIMCEKTSASDATWGIYDYMGTSYTGGSYAVTKAYNNGISDDLSLTNLIIYLRYVKPGAPE